MEGRPNPIESVLRRIEEHVARWREEEQARETEAEADRDELWAQAAERERLLVETIEVRSPGSGPRGRSAGSRGPCLSSTRRRPRKLWKGSVVKEFVLLG